MTRARIISSSFEWIGLSEPDIRDHSFRAINHRPMWRGMSPGLVQQVIDPQDGRRTETFLTVRGNALVHELVRLIRTDRQGAMKLRKSTMAEKSPRDLERDQWLSRLIEAGRKLAANDVQLVVRQVEALIGHRQSKGPAVRFR